MWSVLHTIFLVVLGISALCILFYMPRIFAWFYGFKKQPELTNHCKNRLAVIVPARNESKVIGTLFNSLNAQTYPKSLFDVHVLVKNPKDKTIEMTKNFGGRIHIITEKVCKGHDINVALQTILKEDPSKYDAYVIVDADCCLDEKFLEEMNNAMASGRNIIQGKRLVKNKLYGEKSANNWVTKCNGMIWTIIDEIGNKFKSAKKITNMTIGTGILLTSQTVRKLGGWPYSKTLTEDIELMYDSVFKGFSTLYYNRAKIYVEETTSLSETNKRRTRWMTGVIDSKRLYKEKLKQMPKNWATRKNIYFANALTPVYLLIGINAIFSALFFGTWFVLALTGSHIASTALFFALILFGVIYLSFFSMTLMCLLVDRKTNKFGFLEALFVLFVHPIYYMGYIKIVAKAFLKKLPQEWDAIQRMDLVEVKVWKK